MGLFGRFFSDDSDTTQHPLTENANSINRWMTIELKQLPELKTFDDFRAKVGQDAADEHYANFRKQYVNCKINSDQQSIEALSKQIDKLERQYRNKTQNSDRVIRAAISECPAMR